MKNLSKVMWGTILIVLGLIIAVNSLGIMKIDIFFRGWWTLFIIVPSVMGLIDGKDVKGSFIGIVLGVLLLLSCQGYISFGMILKLIIPLILVVIGLGIIYDGLFDTEVRAKVSNMNSDSENIVAVFSDEKRYVDYDFKGANVDTVFGGVTLNLNDAKLGNETTLKMSAIFGGITLIVPRDVKVKIKSTNIFGGVEKRNEDVKSSKGKEKIIYVEAFTMFGGISVK